MENSQSLQHRAVYDIPSLSGIPDFAPEFNPENNLLLTSNFE